MHNGVGTQDLVVTPWYFSYSCFFSAHSSSFCLTYIWNSLSIKYHCSGNPNVEQPTGLNWFWTHRDTSDLSPMYWEKDKQHFTKIPNDFLRLLLTEYNWTANKMKYHIWYFNAAYIIILESIVKYYW